MDGLDQWSSMYNRSMDSLHNRGMDSLDDFGSAVDECLALVGDSCWNRLNNSGDWLMYNGLMHNWSHLKMMRFQVSWCSSSNGQES